MNINEEKIIEAVAAQITDEHVEPIASEISKKIDNKINKVFAETVQKRVEEVINGIIVDGFNRTYQRVDIFGKPNGELTTIKKELSKLTDSYWNQKVDKKTGKLTDSNYNTCSRAEYTMMVVCAEDFTAEMKNTAINVTAELKDSFRSQLGKHLDNLLDSLFKVKSIQDQGKAKKPW